MAATGSSSTSSRTSTTSSTSDRPGTLAQAGGRLPERSGCPSVPVPARRPGHRRPGRAGRRRARAGRARPGPGDVLPAGLDRPLNDLVDVSRPRSPSRASRCRAGLVSAGDRPGSSPAPASWPASGCPSPGPSGRDRWPSRGRRARARLRLRPAAQGEPLVMAPLRRRHPAPARLRLARGDRAASRRPSSSCCPLAVLGGAALALANELADVERDRRGRPADRRSGRWAGAGLAGRRPARGRRRRWSRSGSLVARAPRSCAIGAADGSVALIDDRAGPGPEPAGRGPASAAGSSRRSGCGPRRRLAGRAGRPGPALAGLAGLVWPAGRPS